MECQSVSITCRFTNDAAAGYKLERWLVFRKAESDANRELVLPGGRFVAATSATENPFTLKILLLRIEDSANYYCKAQYRDWSTHCGESAAFGSQKPQLLERK